MLTGVSPLEHRILDFTRFSPASGQKEPITSDERRAPAIWNMAGYAGRTSATFGLWATYPAERVTASSSRTGSTGFLFTEEEPAAGHRLPRRAREAGRGTRCARSEKATRLRGRCTSTCPGSSAGGVPDDSRRRRRPTPTPTRWPRCAASWSRREVYHRLATRVDREGAADLAIVYFQGTDSIGHTFAPFAPPRQRWDRGAGLRALPRCAGAVLPPRGRAPRGVPRARRASGAPC